MRSVVTGAAGFVGSHLADLLVQKGHEVIGVDCFTPYYPRKQKMGNISGLLRQKRFRLLERDLAKDDLSGVTKEVEYVFHLAAQPGVRGSWGGNFSTYTRNNVLATQRILEATRGSGVKKFIYASSSSIYGEAETFPTSEDVRPSPVSPYGVTKLAGEDLCMAYHRSYGAPVVILRYFTIYGPRQRPDMAISTFISKILSGSELTVFGRGDQERDFTYVLDAVRATLLAVNARPGSVFNVGTGRTVSIAKAIKVVESIARKRARVAYRSKALGDVRRTSADISRISRALGYAPLTTFEEGVSQQVREWLRTG